MDNWTDTEYLAPIFPPVSFTPAAERNLLSLPTNADMEKLKDIRVQNISSIANLYRVSKNPIPKTIIQLKNIIEVMLHEREFDDFFGSKEIAAPVIENLKNEKFLVFPDIKKYARVIGHAETYEETHELALRLLKRLEDFEAEKIHKGIRVCIHLNTILRLIRSKHELVDGELNEENTARLNELFSFHNNLLFNIFSPEKQSVYKGIAFIRKGIFFKDDTNHCNQVEEGFKIIEDTGEIEIYNQLFEEAKRFGLYSEDTTIPNHIAELDRKTQTKEIMDYCHNLTDAELRRVNTLIRDLVKPALS
ncbi:MAG: hypothetical protein FWE44_07975 [Defluviitaleaceae bacterium]|nr:hypothetical protein [Defluviitaleaceae bacterium]